MKVQREEGAFILISKNNLGKNPKVDKKKNNKKNNKNNKTKEAKINHIHDKYFKQSFGDIETAKAFMREYLPKELTKNMDYDSLSIVNPSTIDKNFKLRESDLLYKAEIGKNTWYLYVLLEHKSYIDSHVAIQILRYITDIWEKELKNHKTLTPVLPILFYQGKEAWEFKQLHEFLPKNLPEIYYGYMPLFTLLYYDFSLERQMEIKTDYLPLELYLQSIQKVYEEDKEKFITIITEMFIRISRMEEAFQVEWIEKMLIYFMNSRSDLEEEDYYKPLEMAGGEERMQTLAEKLIERGRAEERAKTKLLEEELIERGKTEGIQQNTIYIARNMKENGLSVDMIINITGLTEDDVNKL